MKLFQIITIADCLNLCSNINIMDAKVNYAIAKNIKIVKPFIQEYHEENELRIQTFSLKENGEPVVKDGKWQFGENKAIADEKYKEIINKDIDVSFYTIQRSEHTDSLPALALSELLDIIIIE